MKSRLITYVKKKSQSDVVELLNHLSVSGYKQYKCLQGGGVINPEYGWRNYLVLNLVNRTPLEVVIKGGRE